MTFVTDPTGTPTVYFQRDGIAQVNIDSPVNTGTPATVDAFAGHVIVSTFVGAATSPPYDGYKLSADFRPGDIVEFYQLLRGGHSALFPIEDENAVSLGDTGSIHRKLRKLDGFGW